MLDDRDFLAQQHRMHGSGFTDRVVDVERVNADACDSRLDQSNSGGLGEVWVVGEVPIRPPLACMTREDQHSLALAAFEFVSGQRDLGFTTPIEADRVDSGHTVERKARQVVPIGVAMKRHVQVRTRIGANFNLADLESGARFIDFLGRLTREVRADNRRWQPGVGHHSVRDDVTEINVAHGVNLSGVSCTFSPVRENEFGQPIGDDLGNWTPLTEMPEQITHVGRYVTLEPLARTQHAIPLFHVFKQSDPRMWTYLPEGPFIDGAELGQLIKSLEELETMHPYAVLVDGEPLGWLTLMRIRPEVGVIEIGWVTFSTQMQQTRASTEAQYLLLKYAFSLGYRRVEWKCDSLNEPSREAAERLGFEFEGIQKKLTHYKGQSRDTAWYGMTDDMWPEIGSGFERWLDPANFDEDGNQIDRLGH